MHCYVIWRNGTLWTDNSILPITNFAVDFHGCVTLVVRHSVWATVFPDKTWFVSRTYVERTDNEQSTDFQQIDGRICKLNASMLPMWENCRTYSVKHELFYIFPIIWKKSLMKPFALFGLFMNILSRCVKRSFALNLRSRTQNGPYSKSLRLTRFEICPMLV